MTDKPPKAREVLGDWVSGEDVHPLTNVSGRAWMTKDGSMSGTYFGFNPVPMTAHEKGLLWHFPVKRRRHFKCGPWRWSL